MIITNFIITSVENIQHYQKIANDNKFHSFTIISINDTDTVDYKKMTFCFDSKDIAYIMTDIFYAGKRAGIKEGYETIKNINNHETAY
jgi:hypothetical protein